MRVVFIFGIFSLLMLGVKMANADDAQLTSATLHATIGNDICSLHEEWVDKFGVYLDKQETHSVSYRATREVKVFFLLEELKNTKKYCGRILDVLNVIGSMKEGMGVEYKCNETGKKKTHWGNIFGLSKDGAESGRYVKPIKAWKVNSETWKFEEISNKGIVCDTTGFED